MYAVADRIEERPAHFGHPAFCPDCHVAFRADGKCAICEISRSWPRITQPGGYHRHRPRLRRLTESPWIPLAVASVLTGLGAVYIGLF
ncbi:MAG: hypothetical protein KJO07_11420 [Deltaproteobacteria bacterium]|nr:hypothetical protein [Deltaproteobacteria bacterium]